MIQLSIFQNFNKVVSNKNFEAIAEIIRNGKFKEQIEQLQLLLKDGKEKAYTEKKKSLFAFTPSAQYKGGRKAEYLQEYSKIIILDIDKIERDLHQVREKAVKCKYTYSCFVSPSGKGLKILVRTDNSVVKHRDSFLKVQAYYEKLLEVKIDDSGKDVSRLCFFSYDKDLYHNRNSETFKIEAPMSIKSDIEKLIEQIEGHQIDITSDYETWLKIGFSIESEFGEAGREYYHSISKYSTDYNFESCNEQYSKCLKNNNSGITIKTLFHFAKQHGVVIKSLNKRVNESDKKERSERKITSNKFTLTEDYLNERYIVRYNVVSNKFEYKNKDESSFKELNENNLYVKLQKDNINISLNNLVALLKSDFVNEYNPFQDYFENLPKWDGYTDYIGEFIRFLNSPDDKRLDRHFRKWIVRLVRTAIDDNYYNKQAFILVSNKQNSGKSTFCRFLCPMNLRDYIVENIGTDKDSLIAITENFIINLDELSTAEKNEINAFKSMFSKDKIKARLTYDKRASIHVRRASFIGSTDRWEFLTDESGSVRWLCFDIRSIDWKYSKKVNIDMVYSQAYHLLKQTDFDYELTVDEIEENDLINKRYQVTTPERDLILQYIEPAKEEDGEFLTATDVLEKITQFTTIKLYPERIGKELKFLGFIRSAKKIKGHVRYGYFTKDVDNKS